MEKNSYRKPVWQPFIITVLGTAIGVALTFVVNGVVARRNKEQAQRLTAIMVIHDIDNTIDILKSWKEREEEGQKLYAYVYDHKDQKECIPVDTLNTVLDLLVRSNAEYHFDTSKEKIFNSDVDVWQNLENIKFIDNVQAIFYERQRLLDLSSTEDWFLEPIPSEEYMPIVMGNGWSTEDEYQALRWAFLKEKMQETRVSYFMNVVFYRISTLSDYINRFTLLNDENKFIMGITDQELDNYVNNISNKGMALTRTKLPGNWLFAHKEQRIEYDFQSDNDFSITNFISYNFTRTRYGSGIIKARLMYTGTWAFQEDSLVLTLDINSLDVEMDPSGIEVKENMQDSLSSLMNRYREYLLKQVHEDLLAQGDRKTYKARLDSSNDKMEWTDAGGEIRYLKRMEK